MNLSATTAPTSKAADRAVVTMAVVRAALGAAAYVAPDRTAVALGLDPEANRQMRYLARVFGARDMALGAAVVASSGDARRLLLRTCVGIEVFDTASAVIAYRTGTVDRKAASALLGAVVAAAIPELVALRAAKPSW